jgi:hypothetical protein
MVSRVRAEQGKWFIRPGTEPEWPALSLGQLPTWWTGLRGGRGDRWQGELWLCGGKRSATSYRHPPKKIEIGKFLLKEW